jgi:cytochrome c553
MNQTFAVTPSLTSVASDSATLARGQHLARIHACHYCHGDNLEGKVFVDAPPFLVVAANLTSGRGGIGQAYTDADWDRALRHGVKPDGKAVIIMPSRLFNRLSDDDANALIAYLKSVPPVDHELPATEVRALGAVIAGTGGLGPDDFINTNPSRTSAPALGPTLEYGTYLTGITCIECHGADLRGGVSPDPEVPGPDLAVAGSWPLDAFIQMMRTGVNPGGKTLNAEVMPWPAFQHMTDDELQAIYEHLKTLGN